MKRPKLFYTPGLISLLVVPVLFYFFQPTIKTQTVIKFFIPKEDHQLPNIYSYSRSSVKATLKGKKINTVYLDEDHALNTIKLEFIAREALKLKFYNDTTQVIKVHFGDETIYNEFIQLINTMYKDLHKRYALVDNDFYIFGEDPPEPHSFICGFGPDVVMIEIVKTWREKLSEEISYYRSPKNALLLSAFVLLIAVPVFIKS